MSDQTVLEKKVITGKDIADYLKKCPAQLINDCEDFCKDIRTLTESMHSLYKDKIIPMTIARINVSINVSMGDSPIINDHFGAVVGDVTKKDGTRAADTEDFLNHLQELYTDEEKAIMKKFKEADL